MAVSASERRHPTVLRCKRGLDTSYTRVRDREPDGFQFFVPHYRIGRGYDKGIRGVQICDSIGQRSTNNQEPAPDQRAPTAIAKSCPAAFLSICATLRARLKSSPTKRLARAREA